MIRVFHQGMINACNVTKILQLIELCNVIVVFTENMNSVLRKECLKLIQKKVIWTCSKTCKELLSIPPRLQNMNIEKNINSEEVHD